MPKIGDVRTLIATVLLAGLGCGLAAAEDVPLPRPHPPLRVEPHSFREAAGEDFNSADVTSKPSDCRLRLEKTAAVEPMPRLIGPGECGGRDMVQLNAVLLEGGGRVEVRPAPVLRCEMAEQFTAWIRDGAAPRLAAAGVPLRSVENFGDFECRGRNRVFGARLSEHGKGNAIDVSSFTLTDGHRIGLTDMTVAKNLREDLRASACARFTTVLGPGSDRHHEWHIHLDLAERRHGYRICEWDVSEPPGPVAVASAQIAGPVPLPVPRPVIAGRAR
ncbi:MAG: extensin family protein [Pseudolabrys sp.]